MIFNPLFIDSEAKQINPVGIGKANSSYLFRDIINVVQNTNVQREFNSSSILTNILNDVKGLTKTSYDSKSKIDDQLNTLLQNLNLSSGFRISQDEYLTTGSISDSTVFLGSTETINKILKETLSNLENEFDMSVKLSGTDGNLVEKQDTKLQMLLSHVQNTLLEGNALAIQINQNNSDNSFTLKIEQINSNIASLSSPDISEKMFSITLLHEPSTQKSDFVIDQDSPNYKESSSALEKELVKKLVNEIDKAGENNRVDGLDPKNDNRQKAQTVIGKTGKLGLKESGIPAAEQLNDKSTTKIKVIKSKITSGNVNTNINEATKEQQILEKTDAGEKLDISTSKYPKEELADSKNINVTTKSIAKNNSSELSERKELENAIKESQSLKKTPTQKNNLVSENEIADTSNNKIKEKVSSTNPKQDSIDPKNFTNKQNLADAGINKNQIGNNTKITAQPTVDKINIAFKNNSKIIQTELGNVSEDNKQVVNNTKTTAQPTGEKINIDFKNDSKIIQTELGNVNKDNKQVDVGNSKQSLTNNKSIEQNLKSTIGENNNISSKEVNQPVVAQKELNSKIYSELTKEINKQEQIDDQSVNAESKVTNKITDSPRLNKLPIEKAVLQPVEKKEAADTVSKNIETKPIKSETVIIELSSKEAKNIDEMDQGLRKTFLQDIQKLTHSKRNSFDNLVNKNAKSSYEPDSQVEQLKDILIRLDENLFVTSRKTESLKIHEDVVKSDFLKKPISIQNNIAKSADTRDSSEHDSSKNGEKNSSKNSVELNSPKTTHDVSSKNTKEVENNKQSDNGKILENHEKTTNKTSYNIVEPNENKVSPSVPNQTIIKEADPNPSTNFITAKVNIKEQFQPELNSKLLHEISEMVISDKKDKVIINLEPASLGKIKIAIEIIENKINAQLKVENHAAKEMLQNQTEFLKDSLSQNGLQLNSLNISLQNSESKNGKAEREKRKETNTEKVEIKEKPANAISSKTMGYNTYEFIA